MIKNKNYRETKKDSDGTSKPLLRIFNGFNFLCRHHRDGPDDAPIYYFFFDGNFGITKQG